MTEREEPRPTAVDDAPPPGPPGPPPAGGDGPRHGRDPEPLSFGDRVRFVLRGIGQLLITLGAVVLLFVVYEVYVTNWFAHREQAKVHQALEEQWDAGVLALPDSGLTTLDGHGIANLYIPRFGKDYAWTIVQGTSDADLEKGPGHYPASQLPGQKGDFAVAGHRVGKGEPFLNLDKLRAGDPVIVETQTAWYVYCVIGAGPHNDACAPGAPGAKLSNTFTDPSGQRVPGREVVDPGDGRVVWPVPNDADVTAKDAVTRYLTMTTCTPKFTAAQRMIVHAVLGSVIKKAEVRTTPAGKHVYDNSVPARIEQLYAGVSG